MKWKCRSRSIAVIVLAAVFVADAARAGLGEQIELLIEASSMAGARVSVSVREAGTGTEIVDIDGHELMIPASNMKLLTTGAALHTLGGDFRFKTRLLRDGDRLIVVGDGDPAFGDPNLLALMGNGSGIDIETFLGLWVEPVRASGVTRLSEVVVDDRIFDRELVHPSWPANQLNRPYCAEVSGLAFQLNTLRWYPDPRPGRRPSVTEFEPKVTWLEVVNKATSNTGPDDRDTVWIARGPRSNTITFYGNVKHRYRTPVPVTVHDMPGFFARLFADRLREAGVAVDSSRSARPDDPLPQGEVIGPVIYTPMSTIVTRCNRDSQNLYAECLIKRMGHAMTGQPGSWSNGGSIVRHAVHQRITSTRVAANVRISDGSGLSRENRVAPATLTAWLETFHEDETLGPILIASLAVGGESGTLRKRLKTVDLHDMIVQAKSGYINGVSCLSGYVTSADGRRRCFSIMVNDLRSPVRAAKRLQDRIVGKIAEDLAKVPVQLGGADEP